MAHYFMPVRCRVTHSAMGFASWCIMHNHSELRCDGDGVKAVALPQCSPTEPRVAGYSIRSHPRWCLVSAEPSFTCPQEITLARSH